MAKVNNFVGKTIEKHNMKMVLGEYVTRENKGDFDGGGVAGDEKIVGERETDLQQRKGGK